VTALNPWTSREEVILTTHLEDRAKSGPHRNTDGSWSYRYGTLCDAPFYSGDPEHALVNPHQPKHRELTCKGCIAEQAKRGRK